MSSVGTTRLERPKDRYYITTCAVFLIGLATMLPWNCFVNAESYWMYKLRDLSSEGTPLNSTSKGLTPLNKNQKLFITYLSTVCNAIFLFVILGNTFIRRVVTSEARVTWSLISTIICMGLVTTFVEINTDSWQSTFMYITLVIAGSTSFVVAILTGSSTGICGLLPSRMMATASMAQSIGGILCTSAQIGCLLLRLDTEESALIFFLLSISTLLITFILWKFMENSEYYKYYRNLTGSPTEILQLSQSVAKTPLAYFSVFKERWHFHLTAFTAAVVTIPLFPSLSYLAVSTHVKNGSMLSGVLFLPVACFLTFNIADFIGRYIETFWPHNPQRRDLLLSLAVLRVVFIPFLVLCNIAPNNREHLPVLIHSDVVFVIVMFASGLSNGYLTNAALVNAPKTTSPENQELSGSLAACSLSVGATVGSFISYLLLQLFEHSQR